jgi:hypothetical protein
MMWKMQDGKFEIGGPKGGRGYWLSVFLAIENFLKKINTK